MEISRKKVLKTIDRTLEQKLKRVLSSFYPLSGWRIPVTLRRGAEHISGRPATVLTAGPERVVGYIPHRFFSREAGTEQLGSIPLWKLPKYLEQLQPTVDLTAVVLDRWSTHLLPKQDYLVSPTWVGSWMPITSDFNERKLSELNHSLLMDLAYVRNNRFTYEISYGIEDMNSFYDRYYLPYVTRRHGQLVNLISRRKMRSILAHGHIFWLLHEGIRQAGMLVNSRGRFMEMVVIGLAEGDLNLLRKGTMASLYYYSIRHGWEMGRAAVFLGGSRPSLHDGVFRYKRKWGAILCEHPGINYEMLLHWNRMEGVVANFLSHTSIIHRDKDRLTALWAYPDGLPSTTESLLAESRSLMVPGLDGLQVIMHGDQPGDSDQLNNIKLLKMKSVNRSTGLNSKIQS